MDMVPDTWHMSTMCPHMSITNSASQWATDKCEWSNWVRILQGIQSTWSQTFDMCHIWVKHVINTCLGYFWYLWATYKSEGSKLGGILPGVKCTWSQTRDMCPTRTGNRVLCMTMLWSMRTVDGVLVKNMETLSVKQTTILTAHLFALLPTKDLT